MLPASNIESTGRFGTGRLYSDLVQNNQLSGESWAHAFMARFNVYSPRRGQTVPYVVSLSDLQLQVAQGIKIATCELDKDGHPTWYGYVMVATIQS